MTIAAVLGLWLVAAVLIMILLELVKLRERLRIVEADLRIIDNTLAKLSTTFLRPTSRNQVNKTMEY